MIENAKPCPFCGCVKINLEHIEAEGVDVGYQASCSQCLIASSTYATEEDAIAFWNTRHELNSTDIIKKAVETNRKSFTACVVVEHTVTIFADDFEEATEKAEACDWEEGSDMSPDFENLKWIEEDE